jgi:hypothetical protein
MAGKDRPRPGKTDLLKCPKTELSKRQNPTTFLASHEDQQKCFVLACTFVFKRNANGIFRGRRRSTSFNPLVR